MGHYFLDIQYLTLFSITQENSRRRPDCRGSVFWKLHLIYIDKKEPRGGDYNNIIFILVCRREIGLAELGLVGAGLGPDVRLEREGGEGRPTGPGPGCSCTSHAPAKRGRDYGQQYWPHPLRGTLSGQRLLAQALSAVIQASGTYQGTDIHVPNSWKSAVRSMG